MDPRTELLASIALVRRRWTILTGLRIVNRAAMMLAALFAAAVLFDRVVHPHDIVLLLVPVTVGAIAIASIGLVLVRVPRSPGTLQVARFIEERASSSGHSLDDAVVSAVEAIQGATTSAFGSALVGRAVQRLQSVDVAELVPGSDLRKAAIAVVLSGGALLVTLALAAPGAARAFETARLRFIPGAIRVEVAPGDTKVQEGASLRILATIHDSGGSLRSVVPTLNLTANGNRRVVAMVRAGDAFEYTLRAVDRSFSYDVSAATLRSATYTVTALHAPRVTRIDLHYTYPAFSRLAPRDEQEGGDVYAPAGTRVRLMIYTDKPIAHGELALGSAALVPLKSTDECTAEAELLLTKDDSYRIRLADADGLKSSGEAEYFVRVMDDRPPDVRILRPSGDQPITPLEEVPIEARADDDYGIASFELVYAVAGGQEHVVPFERMAGTAEQKVGSRLLPAEDLRVKPGDVITYYARARDVPHGKPSSIATSDIFFLEVKPFNEEFVAAESQGSGAGGDPQIESLIDAQKQIIASTWNVERRSQGGRSADDIKAIAAAQAELKTRAEQQLGARSRRPRTRGAIPQRAIAQPAAQRSASEDPLAKAVEAMGNALQQLGAERTKDALSHEMTALNGLLQAQAEVRRRQVTQQANGAGNSYGNRNEQDLSALFDKELQRDQKTNYENRPSVETRPETENKDDALDRIKDLARRQEDLSQRERDLAQSNLSPEERKRQLEKLSREQEELRRELEELARKTARNTPTPGSKDPAVTGRPGSSDPGDLHAAGQQMRSAANDLGRDDPNRAAESSQRAADRLKELARQLSAGPAQSPGRSGRSGDAAADAQSEQLSKQLEQTRAIRERLQQAEQALREAERGQTGVRPGSDRGQTGVRPGSDRGQTRVRPGSDQGQTGVRPGSDRGQTRVRPGSDQDQTLEQLRQAYQRELQKAQEALGRLTDGSALRGDAGATPEQHEWSRSAPGTQAFKQDRSDWDALRKNVDRALEKYEASVSSRLSQARTDDRLSAGGSDRVPEAYRQIIARYFESVAKKKP